MGKGHIAVNKYMSDKVRFADLINGKIFGGEQVVLPEELEKVEGESEILLEDKNKRTNAKTRYRDVVMRRNKGIDFCFFACENQEEIHYAMPVRNMLYDSLSYTNQIAELWKSHNKGTGQDLEPAEYLSRFRKEDKIFPVVTMVFYYGSDTWTGNLDLYSMFRMNHDAKKKLEKYIPNYWVNLIDADSIENLSCFKSDLQKILGMLKCKGNKEELLDYAHKNEEFFGHVDYNTQQAIGEFLQSDKLRDKIVKRKEEKGEYNMCKALDDLYQEGIETGYARGHSEGRNEGRVEQLASLVKKKLEKNMSVDEIAEILEEDVDTIKELITKLKNE